MRLEIIRNLTPHRKRVIVATSVALLFLALVFFVISKSTKVPQQFFDAREKVSETSKTIVGLTNQTVEIIKNANIFDEHGNTERALTLISTARANNNEAYQKASTLAEELKSLAESLQGISSRQSQQLAYESVAVELSLVSEFIVYTNKLNAFLDTLAQAVATNFFASRRLVGDKLNEVNEQARVINSINQDFLDRIGRFDASLR